MRIHARECPKRIVLCEHCGQGFKRLDIQTHIDRYCSEVKVVCDNGCGETMRRADLEKHKLEECSLEKISCPFENQGCKMMCRRSLMKKHLLDNFEMHSRLQAKFLDDVKGRYEKHIEQHAIEKKELIRKNAELEKRVKEIEDWETVTVEWVVNAFRDKAALSVDVWSQAFDLAGYKLKLNLEFSQGYIGMYIFHVNSEAINCWMPLELSRSWICLRSKTNPRNSIKMHFPDDARIESLGEGHGFPQFTELETLLGPNHLGLCENDSLEFDAKIRVRRASWCQIKTEVAPNQPSQIA
eukprot:CAMPEP_0167753510 /NCGR_PEP_ID=MMETSP0110_2-20121227/7754_1 /TAXON_ID=629695 /ORGANISM="Gymnochlora sp., Strain CCMP2014" /LENGTH=296 /DNA_ID=CAMNT_0007639285 /DNA_START=438 /DNA_END=1328 /DNA_ORIENTATION=+